MTIIFRRSMLASLLVFGSFSLALAQPANGPKPRSSFAKLDDIRVHYQNYGTGKEALIFIHGWSCNINFWKANIPAFSSRSRVIAIDLPGHGESDKPQTKYSMDLFARAIDAVMRDAGVERAVLIGHSMGTPVIRQFYRLYPQKTRALVIVDGSLRPFFDDESAKKFLEPFRGPNYKEHAEQMINFLSSSVKNKATLDEIRTAMLTTPQHVMIGAMDGMMSPEIWKDDKINAPALALMANQPQWSDEYVKYARELIPGIDFQIWDGVSHFLMMDEPDKFNEALLAFLRKNRMIE
jgi:pimeloyl-ACP methyl ester carboxylesterase